MKQLIISAFSLILVSFTCLKDDSITARNTNCEMVKITQQGLGCDLWGVEIGGKVYPSFVPEHLRQEGLITCVNYRFYEDPRDCPAPCCGGTWVEIIE